MAVITVRFSCGHELQVAEDVLTPPECPCGESRVARVTARPPTFAGACSGPYAQMKAMTPAVVNVAPGGALKLKER